ncbi:SMP-30/gluconolactonase/LRE family protein [Nocardioides daejeonensis]|uniref:SMP-30/gluconolactonase/LRE family protein n=1 Tax=Nocardioides daejeonensis TaxID=1046556 RepID=UPI001EF697D7|nr:gluconolaconase [Nocardioides daejeonensis]
MSTRTTARLAVTTLAGALTLSALALTPTQAAPAAKRVSQPVSYQLPGDPEGSKFEGIGVNPNEKRYYVTEVTGGEIHRGKVGGTSAREWKPAGADGRTTARGITTDAKGRVYVAGGPNGIGNDNPDLWVYNKRGKLLAAMKTGVENSFLNDVVVGPDGAAYFTNSNAAQIFRVAKNRSGDWKVRTWADASDTIATTEGFNLGGIVVSQDQRSLIVAQGNVGKLWRFKLADRSVKRIRLGGTSVDNADGLVRRGNKLLVVRNFDKVLTTFQLNKHSGRATVVSERPSDADRVFTTAKMAQGRLLLVDSKFDEQTATPPYEVVVRRWQR